MWKKSFVLALSLLFACCSPPLCFSQSTWQDFDKLLQDLRTEIATLSSQIASTEASLTASEAELARLKKLLQERETQYQESVASWTRLNESLKTYESSLRKAQARNWLLGGAALIATGAAIYFALH